MPSTSKSNQQKAKRLKIIQKPNWLDLPSDIMADILHRIGVVDILENAQKVCRAWRKICKEPSMWRVISMVFPRDQSARPQLQEMSKHAVDRSQGQLLDFTLVGCSYHEPELLNYIADRCSQLRRLEIANCCCDPLCLGIDEPPYETLTVEAMKKFPLLEELNIYKTYISKETIETVGRCCPMLKTLKFEQEMHYPVFYSKVPLPIQDEIAVAIGENLGELRHLELITETMTNSGLEVILDGCPYLESLHLCDCIYIDLEGALGKRCSKQIKCLNVSNDSYLL